MYGAGRADLPAALVHAPLAVFPVTYPKASYEKAQAAMPVFNLLIDRISRDNNYLQRTLAPAAEFDDFTVSIWVFNVIVKHLVSKVLVAMNHLNALIRPVLKGQRRDAGSTPLHDLSAAVVVCS